jgi:hypothetical protein
LSMQNNHPAHDVWGGGMPFAHYRIEWLAVGLMGAGERRECYGQE